jgi:hypothetical protein
MDVPVGGDFLAIDVTTHAGQIILARQALNGKSDLYRDVFLPITIPREEVIECRCIRSAPGGWVKLDYVYLEAVE